MSDYLRKNQILLRSCILFEFAEGKPIFEAFRHFCELLGEEAMDYPEFEFWYQRFAAGDMDLSYEREYSTEMSDNSSDDAKKSMEQPNHDLPEAMGQLSVSTDDSNQNSPTLSDMPVDVIALIIDRSDYRQQLKLRKVSKSLRALVDKQKPACKSIQVEYWDDRVVIIFNGQYVMYSIDGRYIVDGDIAVKSYDFEKAAVEDLAATLKNPRLQLEKLNIVEDFNEKDDSGDYCDQLRNLLKSLNHQLSVKRVKLEVSHLSYVLSILPYLKPCVLKTIHLSCDLLDVDWIGNSSPMDQVVLLEQWQQAEELELWNDFDIFPIEHVTHFKRFRFVEGNMDGDKFMRIIEFLSKLENFEHCTLTCFQFESEPDLVYQLLGAPVSSNTTEEIFRQPVANSDYYFQSKKAKDCDYVEIEKKKRENA